MPSPLIRKITDAEGHEHDARGRFSSTGGMEISPVTGSPYLPPPKRPCQHPFRTLTGFAETAEARCTQCGVVTPLHSYPELANPPKPRYHQDKEDAARRAGGSPPLLHLRKVRDDEGHEHGADGRFVGTDGGGYKHGEAASVPFMRNTAKAPRVANPSRFGQDIEPHGRYVSERSDTEEAIKDRLPNYETGTINFKKPLVLPFGGDYDQGSNWKRVLVDHYGKKGKALSQAIARDGYDGIITHDKYGTSEIVDLSMFAPKVKKVRDDETEMEARATGDGTPLSELGNKTEKRAQAWAFRRDVEFWMTSSPPILRKVRDDSGHEHDDKGQFSRTSGRAKPKGKREDISHETLDQYPHPKTGAQQPMHHAGGRKSWGGKFSQVAQDTFGTQFGRWDDAIPDNIGELDGDQMQPYVRHARQAHANMRNRIATLEASFAGKKPTERAAARQENRALYYDRARAWRCDMRERGAEGTWDDQMADFVALQRTHALASLLVAENPKDIATAENLYDAARAKNPLLPELSSKEIGREVLLHKYGVDARSSMRGRVSPGALSEFSLMTEGETEPTETDMRNFEWAMDKTWKSLGLAATPAVVTFCRKNNDGPFGAALADGSALNIGVNPAFFTLSGGSIGHLLGSIGSDNEYTNTVAHEMAHLLSHKNFPNEIVELNARLNEEIWEGARLHPRAAKATEYMTRHGAQQQDMLRYQPGGERGDFQEDWAITLSEFYLNGKSAFTNSRGPQDGNPARETVTLVGQLLGLPLHKRAVPLDKLKQFPSAANPRGLPQSFIFKAMV